MAETRCPNCGGWNIYGCLWHSVRSCEDCGYEWKEVDDLEEPENFGLVTSYDIEMGKMDESPDDASPPTAGEAE